MRTAVHGLNLRCTTACLCACMVLLGALAQAQAQAIEPAASATQQPGASDTPQLLRDGGLDVGISLVQERRIGDRIVRDLYRDPDYLDDPVIADYLQSVWQPLLQSAREQGALTPDMERAFAWRLLQGRDRTVNAFALPGGYFGVHLGLLGLVGSRDELAAVLAHELSHVTQRHIARIISRQSKQTPWLVGAMILGALAASKSPDGANAVIAGGQAVAAQVQLNFSRDMEREADRAGLHVATQAGFAPEGFVSMFEKLQNHNRNNDAGNFPYLRSHPLTAERIADMRARIASTAAGSGMPVPAVGLGYDLEHVLVSARARVLAAPGVDALRNHLAEATPARLAQRSPPGVCGVLYAASLAAYKLREFDQAHAYAQQLRTCVGSDVAALSIWRMLQADIAKAQNDPRAALQTLGAMPVPRQRAPLLLWVELQISLGTPAAAADAAQLWVSAHPQDASMWLMLERARAAQGRTLAAIRAQAEAAIAELDYAGGLARLEAAQSLARTNTTPADHIEASIVDVRLRQVQELLREQSQPR